MANNQVSSEAMTLAKRQIMCDFINETGNDLKIDLNVRPAEDTGNRVMALCQIIHELTNARIIYVDDDGEVGPVNPKT